MNEEINKVEASSDSLSEKEEGAYYEKFENIDKSLNLNKENLLKFLTLSLVV